MTGIKLFVSIRGGKSLSAKMPAELITKDGVILDTPEKRTLSTVREAVRWGDEWRRHAERLEILLLVATAQWKSSDLLLRIAEEEIARLKKLVI